MRNAIIAFVTSGGWHTVSMWPLQSVMKRGAFFLPIEKYYLCTMTILPLPSVQMLCVIWKWTSFRMGNHIFYNQSASSEKQIIKNVFIWICGWKYKWKNNSSQSSGCIDNVMAEGTIFIPNQNTF